MKVINLVLAEIPLSFICRTNKLQNARKVPAKKVIPCVKHHAIKAKSWQ